MNRRTKRRLIVLAVLAGGIAVAGVGGTMMRKAQRAQMAERSRAEGLAAYEAKDYHTAVGKLRTHLRIAGEDSEALTALGDSQRYVEEPNYRHLINARTYLDIAVSLDPQNVKAREILLDVHLQLGNWAELAEIAGELLELDPGHEKAARRRIEANLQRGNQAEALKAARELVTAQDGSIDAHLEVLRVLQQTNRNPREQREYLENEIAPKYEGTTAMAVLRAIVEYDGGQTQRATEFLLQAGEAGATDGKGARMLLETLELVSAATDNHDLYARSEDWLAQWLEDETLAPHLFEVAAGRAWRSGLPQRAVDLALRATGSEPTSEAVFAWGLLGAMELRLENEDATTRLRESFEAAINDENTERAARWLELIDAAERLARGKSASEALPLASSTSGISATGLEGVAAYFDAIDDASRRNTQEAVNRLAELAQQPSWRRARYVLASVLHSSGRPQVALSVLGSDETILELEGAAELASDAWASVVELSGNPDNFDPSRFEQALESNPEDPTLLSALGRGALARGETDRAIELARRLSAAEAARAAISAVRFARALEAVDRPLAEEVVDRVAVTATTPRQVAAAATGLAGFGLVERARELIDDRAADELEGSAHDWDLARIQLANTIGDAEALDTLERISADNASDARIQIEILNAEVIWTRLDRTGQVIARLRDAQGEASVAWRVFEVRRLLAANDSIDNANAAVDLLDVVFASDRGKRDTRAMLVAADAFERAGPIDDELRALQFAADGNDPLAALPRLIDRLQGLGRSSQAADRLAQFAEMANVPPETRVVRAQLLQRQGMHEQAGRDIAALASAEFPQYVLRAGVMRRDPGSQEPLSEKEIRALESDLRPQDHVYAAELLARVDRFDDGLARLESLPAQSEAGSRAVIIAQFLAEQGQSDRALTYLTQHAEATGDADAWMEAARMLIGELRVDEAIALLDRASEALPGNAAIAAFKASIDQDSTASPFDRMAQFTASAADREDASDGLKALGAIAKRYVSGQIDLSQAARSLDELSQQRATLYPVWPLLVAAYQELQQPDQAVQRVRNAVTAMPGDPRPARDAAQLLLDMGRFDEALGMADRWRSLATDPRSQAEANMALGVAEYARGNTDRTIGLLLPLGDRMIADTQTYNLPLRTLVEALVSADRMAEAETILMPLAQGHEEWAAFMASVATIAPDTPENTDRAVHWLETLTPMVGHDAQGTAYVASGWMTLFDRTQDAAFADRVVALAESASRSGVISWQLEAAQATAFEARAEYSQAVAAYERAMESAGARVPALLNNAAWLLTSHLGEHERAVALAQEAVSGSTDPAFPGIVRATFHHTLGAAQLASGDAPAALRTFDEGLQLAQTPSLRLGRIEALVAANRRTEARDAFGRLQPGEEWSASQRSRYEELRVLLGSE